MCVVDVSYYTSGVQISCTKMSERRRHLKMYTACLSVVMASIGIGTVMSYTTPSIPDLNHHRNPFHINSTGTTWVMSIIYISGIIGGAVGGVIVDKCGRKFVLVLTSLLFTCGWLLITAMQNQSWIIIGRFANGFSIGLTDVVVPTYIAEIAVPNMRGLLCSCHELGVCFGSLFVFACGCFLHWNWIAVVCMAFPALLMVSLLFIPESPRWLLSQGRAEDCVEVLQHLRGQEDVVAEMSEIVEILQVDSSDYQWKEFLQSEVTKPLFVITGLMFFQQMSGDNPLLGYLVEILNSTRTSWNPYLISVGLGLVGVTSILVSAVVVDRLGRRIMLMISSGVMVVGMAGLSSFFTIKSYYIGFDMNFLRWLPMVSVMTFHFGLNIGYGPIPFYLASEMFPLRIRGIACGIVMFCFNCFGFMSIFIFSYLCSVLENYELYWGLTIVSVCAMIYAFLVVPETKGKSLENIEMEFKQ